MSTEENKTRQRRIVEEFVNHGDTSVVMELMAEDHITLGAGPEPVRGRAAFIDQVTATRTAFPDMEYSIEAQVAEGDTVACLIVWRGTHQGMSFGIPPTGKQVVVRCTMFDTFVDGQCKNTQMLMDTMSLMQQLGAIPKPTH